MLVLSDSRTIGNRSQIAEAAVRHRLPTMYAAKNYVQGGGLMSHGPDLKDSVSPLFTLTKYYGVQRQRNSPLSSLPVSSWF